MKFPLLIGVSLLFSASAASAQTTNWGAKSTLPSSPSMSGSLPSSRSKTLSSGLPGNTLSTGGMYGTPAGTTQNTMLSHNRHVRFTQRHTDANNPLLHAQGSPSTPGLLTPMTPSSMSPMSTPAPGTLTR